MHIRKIAIAATAVVILGLTVSSAVYAVGRRVKSKPAVPTVQQVTVPYSIRSFGSMEISNSIDVKYIVSPTISLTAKGAEDDLKYVKAQVIDGVLKIGREYPVGYRRSNYDGVEVTLSAPAIDKITLSGTATITVDNAYNLLEKSLTLSLAGATRAYFNGPVSAKAVDVAVVGTSRVSFEVLETALATLSTTGSSVCSMDSINVDVLNAKSGGSSKIYLGGTNKKAIFNTSGGSVINATALTSRTVLTTSTGSSQIKCKK